MQTIKQLLSGELLGSKHLKISCELTRFPEEIFSLSESLEILDLSGNKLSVLPNDFGRLKKLRIAFFSDNLFKVFPAVLSNCEQLEMIGFKSNQIETVPENSLPKNTRWLILTNNKIKQLPSSIGNCLRLQKVALAGNQLTELPIAMKNCVNLELLRISANKLAVFPDWLLTLPKLAWLAFAGNSFNNKKHFSNELPNIDWSDFDIAEQLGEGASGNIYKATSKEGETKVAIKVFKGDVTSDGFPEDEMQNCIIAGNHANLVGLIGQIKNHPQGKQGLIMKLIPPNFLNLGKPPNFTTCTRDTFENNTEYSAGQILKIAREMASAMLHLHQKGIMHGDFYAHNILVDENSNCLIGDFGAATFYATDNFLAEQFQKIECRAFGCLLDDLLSLISSSDKDLELTKNLAQLKADCMKKDTVKRPSVDSILQRINNFD